MTTPDNTVQVPIIVISDGTGTTARDNLDAAGKQFGQYNIMVKNRPHVRDPSDIRVIISEAKLNNWLVVYTLVSEDLRRITEEEARRQGVRTVDLLGPLLNSLADYLHAEPANKPGILHAVDEGYDAKISAYEFTRQHDDGKNLKTLHLADVVLVGASRTGKSPLTYQLALDGYYAANVPLVHGLQPPRELLMLDSRRVFCLTIEPDRLLEIRSQRMKRLMAEKYNEAYAHLEFIYKELNFTHELAHGYGWKLIDTTAKSVEELAYDVDVALRENFASEPGKIFLPRDTETTEVTG
ncbi:MAG: putative pyruvate, phosphate dikinase regulatory protein [bacterium]|nr:putative pyruvate, phosphate dikinase regulatory protein [bacterium]